MFYGFMIRMPLRLCNFIQAAFRIPRRSRLGNPCYFLLSIINQCCAKMICELISYFLFSLALISFTFLHFCRPIFLIHQPVDFFSMIAIFILFFIFHMLAGCPGIIFYSPGGVQSPRQVSRCVSSYVRAWSLCWQLSSPGFRPLCSCPFGDSDIEPPCQGEMMPRWHGDNVCEEFGGLMAQIPTQVHSNLFSPVVQLTLEIKNTRATFLYRQ